MQSAVTNSKGQLHCIPNTRSQSKHHSAAYLPCSPALSRQHKQSAASLDSQIISTRPSLRQSVISAKSGRAVVASATRTAGFGGTVGSQSSHDLLIVGPGVLGGYLGKLWREAFPHSNVFGLSKTTVNHTRLSKLGLTPVTKETLEPGRKFPYVAFTVPPSGSQDYAGDVAAAMDRWDGTGSCVFSSSMGVCPVDDGSVVREDCPTATLASSPAAEKLLGAEEVMLQRGGNVLRLVGLYHAQRGAHTYFMRVGDVPRPSDHMVNLIHYEDAARLALSILRGDGSSAGPYRGRVFMGSDNNPITFKEMMDACVASGAYPGAKPVRFTQPDVARPHSKRADNSGTRAALGGWEPRYSSFIEFMEQTKGAGFYSSSGF